MNGRGAPGGVPTGVVVALPVALVGASMLAPPVPLVLAAPAALGAVAVAAWRRARWLAVAGLALLAGTLADRAWSGLEAPTPLRIDAEVTLTGDPRPTNHGVRVEVRHEGRRYDVFADGAAAGTVRDLLTGERVRLAGVVEPRDPGDRWRASRHVAGTVRAEHAFGPAPGPWLAGMANAVHRSLQRGARDLDWGAQGVLRGVVVGDTRDLPAEAADDLRIAGLTHLTAVSGQHVALVLIIVAPVVGRFPGRARLAAVLVALGWFALLTRAEPSVLRAVLMAGLAETVRARGTRAAALRVLAVAVSILVLVDPLIVWAVAFQLSVVATAGIILAAGPLAARLRGPRLLREPMAITLSAQVAAMPLLVTYFDEVTLVSVPANLLVAPVVGWLLGWGLTAGIAAGVLGANVAALVHQPTAVIATWVLEVARWAAALPVGSLETPHVVALWCAGVVGLVGVWRRRPLLRRAGVGGVFLAVAVAALPGAGPPVGHWELTTGAELWSSGEAVALVLDGRTDPARLLWELRAHDVRSLDVVVVRSSGPRAAGALRAARYRAGVGAVYAPAGATIEGARIVARPRRLDLGPLVLDVAPDGEHLAVEM